MPSLLSDSISFSKGKNRGTKPDYFYEIYDRYFKKDMANFLELGVLRGQSLYEWHRRFPSTQIYGIDKNPKYYFEEDNIKVFIGDMADPKFLQDVIDETGPLDVIIDDGAHQSEFNLPAFNALWPHVKPGGLYIIEDLNVIAMADRRVARRTGRVFESINEILHYHSLKAGRISADRQVRFVHWWEGLCILGKK